MSKSLLRILLHGIQSALAILDGKNLDLQQVYGIARYTRKRSMEGERQCQYCHTNSRIAMVGTGQKRKARAGGRKRRAGETGDMQKAPGTEARYTMDVLRSGICINWIL